MDQLPEGAMIARDENGNPFIIVREYVPSKIMLISVKGRRSECMASKQSNHIYKQQSP